MIISYSFWLLYLSVRIQFEACVTWFENLAGAGDTYVCVAAPTGSGQSKAVAVSNLWNSPPVNIRAA